MFHSKLLFIFIQILNPGSGIGHLSRAFVYIFRRDSQILTFHVPPLEDSDFVMSVVYNPQNIKKLGSPGTAELNRFDIFQNFSGL